MLKNRKRELTLLTCLRGLAALWVVFYHIVGRLEEHVNHSFLILISQGYLAVDFFFILSGFVLAMNYQNKFENGFKIADFVIFIKKRVARIYPLHIIMLFAFTLFPLVFLFFDREFSFSGRYDIYGLILSIFLMNSWFGSELYWNVPSWSISTEMLAYLLFPMFVILFAKLKTTVKILASILTLLFFIWLIFSVFGAKNLGDAIPQLGWVRCVLEFCIGMQIFNLLSNRSFNDKNLLITVFFSLILCVSLILLGEKNYSYMPLLLSASLIIFIKVELSFSFRTPRVFYWLGEISYSVYLSHYFIRDVMKLFVSEHSTPVWWIFTYLIITLVASSFLYEFVEKRGKALLTSSPNK